MKYKCIVMDVDGTLISSGRDILPETKEALLKVQESGVKLILASGRPVMGLVKLAKDLDMFNHHGYFVAYNGSQVIDCQTMEVLFNQALSVEEGKAILHHLKQFEVRPLIVKGEYAYVHNVYDSDVTVNGVTRNIVDHESHDNGYKLCEVDDLEGFVDFPLNKILTIGEPEYLQAHYQEMYAPFTSQVNAMFTAPFYYEYTSKGIDKTNALSTVLKPLGYHPEEMIAFGDAQNDSTMLQYCGKGIAMGNATEELKAIADEVTESVDNAGIAKALYKYFPELFD